MLGAWKGLAGFAGRGSLRGWLYTVVTQAAMRVGSRRPKRQLSLDLAPTLGARRLGIPAVRRPGGRRPDPHQDPRRGRRPPRAGQGANPRASGTVRGLDRTDRPPPRATDPGAPHASPAHRPAGCPPARHKAPQVG
ncbi:MAG: hypothetical protein ACRDQF_09610 [Thermocrispum sp.]